MSSKSTPESGIAAALTAADPSLRISTAIEDRLAFSRDCWPLYQLRLQQHSLGVRPALIVWPESAVQVASVYKFAAEHNIPVTPYGGGSGVCGGALPDEGAIVMDLKRLDRLFELSPEDGVATVGSGWIGQNLEHELNAHGFTCGHFPSSIMCSTVGGWLAARGAGQLSTRYGKFEDRMRGVEWVYPDGTIEWAGDTAFGRGTCELFAGSEGILGTATAVRMRIDPLPEARLFRSWEFETMDKAVAAMRVLMQSGLHPAAVRLYDPLDTLLHSNLKKGGESAAIAADSSGGNGPGILKQTGRWLYKRAERFALQEPGVAQMVGETVARTSLLILMFEGPQQSAAWQATRSDELLSSFGRPLGEGPGRNWFEHRYDVSWKQAGLLSAGGFVDTMEVAFPWSRLLEGYNAVREAMKGEAILLAHFSHVYETGACIYFSFSNIRRDPEANERQYRDVWRRGQEAVVRSGGTITHHHGVGLLKARWMADELQGAHGYLRNLKDTMDPERIANPGKLGL